MRTFHFLLILGLPIFSPVECFGQPKQEGSVAMFVQGGMARARGQEGGLAKGGLAGAVVQASLHYPFHFRIPVTGGDLEVYHLRMRHTRSSGVKTDFTATALVPGLLVRIGPDRIYPYAGVGFGGARYARTLSQGAESREVGTHFRSCAQWKAGLTVGITRKLFVRGEFLNLWLSYAPDAIESLTTYRAVRIGLGWNLATSY